MALLRKKKLQQPSVRRASRYAVITAFISLFLWSGSVQAQNPIITEPTDIWFDYSEPTQFVAQTYMVEGYPSDPMLWLYDEQGVQLAANDDSYGLQSYISIAVPAGRYRLRAGICCGDPNAWRTGGGWNLQYELGFNGVGSMQTTTTEESTTTTSTSTTSTTTTTSTSTTTSTTTTTTTTTIAPTTTSTTSTTVEPTTTTSTATTTTVVQPTTSTSTSTTTSSTSTTIPVTTTTENPTTTTTIPVEIPPVISQEEAVALATSPEVLATITPEEATQVFEALNVDDLSDAQIEALVEAVQEAPQEVREAFEEEINIFGGAVDTYIPVGSTIPVSQRRALIAIAGMTAVAAVASRRK